MNKLIETRNLALNYGQWAASSPADWMRFLDLAARMYKYPFGDQILIYAQKPDATACATLDIWNSKLNRWVNRGAKGIALIDDTVTPQKLRYVFDVSSTHAVRSSDEPYIWKLEDRHKETILNHIAEEYDLGNPGTLSVAFREIASQIVDANFDEFFDAAETEMSGSRFGTLPYDERMDIFRNTLESSICYTLARRCGLDAERIVSEAELKDITLFNRMSILTVIGNACSRLTETVLTAIGREVRKFDKENPVIPLEKSSRMQYNRFSTLERESAATHNNKIMQGGIAHGTEILPQRGLSVPESGDRERRNETGREVRTDEEVLPEGAQAGLVSEHADDGQAGHASGGHRGSSAEQDGDDHGSAAENEPRAEQRDGSDGLGSAHEQSDGAGRGDRTERTDLLLTEDELPTDEAETEMVSALSLPETPTAQQQIDEIRHRVLSHLTVETDIPSEVIDGFLRTGGGRRQSIPRIVYFSALDLPEEKRVELLRKEYQEGSKGLDVNGQRYTMTYDKDGIRFAEGHTARNNPASTLLTWEQVSERVTQLLEAGQFVQQGVLDTYNDEILNEYAQTLWYMKRDMKEEPAHVFDGLDMNGNGFEDDIAKIVTILKTPEMRDELISRLDIAAEVYEQDSSIMRFHMYKPNQIAELFHRLDLPQKTFTAEPGFIPDTAEPFITQDSMDQILLSGGPYSESRLSIYSQFCMHKDMHDRIEYLKDHFGTGGRSPALRYTDAISEEYDSKGIRLSLGSMVSPDDSILMSWQTVANRLQMLINADRYLTAQDREHMPDYEKQQLAGRIVSFYDGLPEGFTSIFKDADRSDKVKKAIDILNDPDATENLIENMMDVLAATPADDRRYEFRARTYTEIFGFAEGTFTLFPEEQPLEQMSMETLFDYIDQPAGENNTEIEEVPSVETEPKLAPGMQFEVDGRSFVIDSISDIGNNVSLTDVTFRENTGYPIMRIESYDTVLGWLRRQQEKEHENDIVMPAVPQQEPVNYRIDPYEPGHWDARDNCRKNIEAIRTLKQIEAEGRLATPEEQVVLSGYIGWGGIPQVFDPGSMSWKEEYTALKELLAPEEYEAARSTTLNAFYTDPAIAQAICEKLEQMGLKGGNLLEPSCGVGNFMGVIPGSIGDPNVYGVELDSISGRIAKQLYQKSHITIDGFERAELPESFFDCVVGNVPFGNYGVADKKYDRFHFLIHDYFIARSLDLVRPGGVVALITTSGTMDKQNDSARRYIAERADLLGAIRLPNNAFSDNANTQVVTDILFLQKRESRAVEMPEWVGTMTSNGITMNKYFFSHLEMVLGTPVLRQGRFGQEMTVQPFSDDLQERLKKAMSYIEGSFTDREITDTDLTEPDLSIPADPSVRNFSYADISGKVYYRENARMVPVNLPQNTAQRVLDMVALRNTIQTLLDAQLRDTTDEQIAALQEKLNAQYDAFVEKHGLISSSANRRAFSQDSSYCLLSSLEILDEDGNLKRKADIFSKRTIRKPEPLHSVDTASEALALSLSERARVDIPFMCELCSKDEDEIISELSGIIFKDPGTGAWLPGDEYLSGNVREKLREAKDAARYDPDYDINVRYLTKVQPKDLEASDIEVRLGATWIAPEYINQFMREVFHTPYYRIGTHIKANYAEVSGAWFIDGKTYDKYNATVETTYGTSRVNGYKLLEDALNLKDTRIYDLIDTADGQQRVLNKKETVLAQQKQEMIRAAFREWIFRDVDRREALVQKYNELFNSIRPREYDGSHIRFVGMTPEITLMPHQRNAVAHMLYGKNTLLAHCVGAGKSATRS